MDATTHRYHTLLTFLEKNTITTLEKAHGQRVQSHLASQQIHTAQIYAASLGSQLGKEQLEGATQIGYVHIKPVVIAASITIGMLTVTARTAIIDAYRESTIATYTSNGATGWIWVVDSGPCDWCLSMNGTKHLLTEKFESHNNCRCTTVPII